MSVRVATALVAFVLVAGAGIAHARVYARQTPFVPRALSIATTAEGFHAAIAYGPHRDGQRPGGAAPTCAQVHEDLVTLAKRWPIVRVYDAVGTGDTVLAVIRRAKLPTRVVLGVWLAAEDRRDSTGRVLERFPEAVARNRAQVDAAARLVRANPRTVIAITVGNETQVYWSGNRLPAEQLVAYLREMRARTRVPVSTADDFNFWNKPESDAVAAECDFVFTHLHPLWNGTSLENAVPWIERELAPIRARHANRLVVIGETGWATQHNAEGDQGKLMKGEVGEAEQARFCRALGAWLASSKVPAFLFEAFDENWKGGADPADVEKHWGLYRADRSPKAVMEGGS